MVTFIKMNVSNNVALEFSVSELCYAFAEIQSFKNFAAVKIYNRLILIITKNIEINDTMHRQWFFLLLCNVHKYMYVL